MTPTEMRDTPTEEEMKAAIERLKWFAAACRKPADADDERFGDYISDDDGSAAADIDLLLSVQPSRPQGGWQPIETAPRDGTEILVCGCSCGPRVRTASWGTGRYLGRVKGYERAWTSGPGNTCDPSRWMPLPEPPALSRNPQQGEGS